MGDLHPSVTNINLMQTFKEFYPSVFEAKVICDPVSRESKGYGFIKFAMQDESEKALKEMQGKPIMGRTIKLNYASLRNRNQNNQGNQQQSHQRGGGMHMGGSGGGGGNYNNYMQ